MHPRWTLVSMSTGLASIAGMMTALIATLAPFSTAPNPWLQAHLAPLVLWLGTVAGSCMGLSALGRSIAPLIDAGPAHNDPDEGPASK